MSVTPRATSRVFIEMLTKTRSLAALTFALASVASHAADYDPAQTRVAVVPVLNLSGETWKEARAKQSARGEEELRALFDERGFTLIDSDEVSVTAKRLSLDFADDEQPKRAGLLQLGRELKADLIVFVVINNVDQRRVEKTFVKSTEGTALIKGWLIDVASERPWVSGKVFEGDSKSAGLLEIGEKGSSRKQLAVANGIRKVFTTDFLRDYPVVKKVKRSKVD